MKTTVRLTESALMLAVAFVLSLIPVMQMPFGGSITLASMLPILVIAYRHGTVWGLLVGFAGSLLQLLTGLNNLSYATSAGAVIAIILLDYVIAFTVLGLGGLFRRRFPQAVSLGCGVLLCCALRYLCHVISGCTVWAGISIPDAQALLYSLSYNAAYMVPETIVTLAAAVALAVTLDLKSEQPRRAPATKGQPLKLALLLTSVTTAAIGGVWALQAVQSEDGYALAALSTGDIIAVAVCLITATICAIFAARKRKCS